MVGPRRSLPPTPRLALTHGVTSSETHDLRSLEAHGNLLHSAASAAMLVLACLGPCCGVTIEIVPGFLKWLVRPAWLAERNVGRC